MMENEYLLFFDGKKQDKTASTVKQAVAGLFGFLEIAIHNHIHHEYKNLNDSAWIVQYYPKTHNFRRCSRSEAEQDLKTYGKIEVYAQSIHHGIFISGKAIRYEQQEEIMNTTTVEQLQATEKAEETISKLLSQDDEDTWQVPSEVDPIEILHIAETRIFAYHLHKSITKTQLNPDYIEQMCEFTPGTILQMLQAVNPLRPTTKMVDQLARILKIEPKNLWVDLVPLYLDKTDRWVEYKTKETT